MRRKIYIFFDFWALLLKLYHLCVCDIFCSPSGYPINSLFQCQYVFIRCFWWSVFPLKGYLCYKTIFCLKVASDAQLTNFFIWRKNNVLFSRYLDFFWFCEIHWFQHLWRHHRDCYIIEITLTFISFES